MNPIIFAAAAFAAALALSYLLIRHRARQKRRKLPKPAVTKPNPNDRVISCPACAQQIKFTLPLKSNKAQCRKCAAQFKLDVDAHGNVYITEIKLPEDDTAIKTLDECFTVLDVKSDAIPMDIRTAYKKKISEYHPDKVENLGAKIRQVAEEETRRINAAYAMLQEAGRV
ncbi:J domain-containing protein [Methylomonas koyamae]|uniref:J domain-containing protein n=1 Tax=Methylomonas koyamae TaxID=702114 RepID=UPI00287348B2|nr:J domain-containing protein [Methylomonas koyamae]WNB76594.1 J domain-containing protein [Methylomonas koyamae]